MSARSDCGDAANGALQRAPVIAIDGPSGAGKGTVSRALARALGWSLLDSGALYRLVALAAREAGIDLADESAVARVAMTLEPSFSTAAAEHETVRLGGRDVTRLIRTEQAGNDASKVAAHAAVRRALLDRQRRFAVPPGLVADGRDMGTVVFPDADLKIFLTASAEERAARRHKQLKEQGVTANLAALSLEIAERDQRDRTRAASPLLASAGAMEFDTTGLSIEAVVESILQIARERMKI